MGKLGLRINVENLDKRLASEVVRSFVVLPKLKQGTSAGGPGEAYIESSRYNFRLNFICLI